MLPETPEPGRQHQLSAALPASPGCAHRSVYTPAIAPMVGPHTRPVRSNRVAHGKRASVDSIRDHIAQTEPDHGIRDQALPIQRPDDQPGVGRHCHGEASGASRLERRERRGQQRGRIEPKDSERSDWRVRRVRRGAAAPPPGGLPPAVHSPEPVRGEATSRVRTPRHPPRVGRASRADESG